MTYSIAAYGKLPVSPEFLRHNCYEGAGATFKSWVDAGHDAFVGVGEQYASKAGPLQRVLFDDGRGKQLVAATVAESSDGDRRFPFTVFTCLPKKVGVSLRALDPAWRQLAEAHERLLTATTRDHFHELVEHCDAAPLEAAETQTPVAGSSTLRQWVSGLFAGENSEERWAQVVMRLRNVAEAFARGTKRSGGIRVPLNAAADGEVALVEQAEWWRSCAQALGMTPSHSACVRATDALLWFRAPQPEDFGAVLAPVVPVRAMMTDLIAAVMEAEAHASEANPSQATGASGMAAALTDLLQQDPPFRASSGAVAQLR